jgi:hypothetical protein
MVAPLVQTAPIATTSTGPARSVHQDTVVVLAGEVSEVPFNLP